MSQADEDAWTPALPLDELRAGELVARRFVDVNVLLVRLDDGEVRAYEDRCPHQGARLSEGLLAKTSLRCMAHYWEFDVRTGVGINPARCELRAYPVRIVDGVVMLRLPR